MSNIVIAHCPLETGNGILRNISDEIELIDAIKSYIKNELDSDIEVFEVKRNIAITEEGYYCAFFESDLKHA